jgi:ribosomal protein S14
MVRVQYVHAHECSVCGRYDTMKIYKLYMTDTKVARTLDECSACGRQDQVYYLRYT